MSALAHLAQLAVFAFCLHIIWERAHVHLYKDYEGLSGRLPITLWAAIGDVLYTLGAVLLIALLKNNFDWIPSATLSDFVALSIVGLVIALYVEYRAFVLRRWAYTSAMPLIPVLKVGLSPILEMVVLLPLSVGVVASLSHISGI